MIRELLTLFSFRTDEAALGRYETAMRGVKSTARFAAATVAGAATTLLGFVKTTAHAGEEVKTMSERLGVNAQELQRWRYAAELSNSSAGALDTAIRFLRRSSSAAAGGGKEMVEAYSKLGISMEELKKKSPTQILEEIAKKTGEVGFAEKNADALTKTLGRSYISLVPMLKKGGAELAALRKEADELGIVLDDSTIEASGVFQDTWKRIVFTMTGIKNVIGSDLLPVANEIIESTFKWVKANRELLRVKILDFLRGLAFLVRGAWEWLRRFIGITLDVIDRLGGFENAVRLVTFALMVITATRIIRGIAALTASIRALTVAGAWAALWPVLLAAAIALTIVAIQDLWTWMNGGESTIGRLLGSFEDFKSAMSLWVEDTKRIFRMLLDDITEFIKGWYEREFKPYVDLIVGAWEKISGAAHALGFRTSGERAREGEAETSQAERDIRVDRANAAALRGGAFSEDEIASASRFAGRRGAGIVQNVKTDIKVELPPGSTEEHRAIIDQHVRDVMLERDARMLRELAAEGVTLE